MTSGVHGTVGPNDYGYINYHVRQAAEHLVQATVLYSEGHYAHSNAREVPPDHPLAAALRALARLDQDTCGYANIAHEPSRFQPHQPTHLSMHRWDNPRYVGTPGSSP